MSRKELRKTQKRVHHNYNCQSMNRKWKNRTMREQGASAKEFKAQGFKIVEKS